MDHDGPDGSKFGQRSKSEAPDAESPPLKALIFTFRTMSANLRAALVAPGKPGRHQVSHGSSPPPEGQNATRGAEQQPTLLQCHADMFGKPDQTLDTCTILAVRNIRCRPFRMWRTCEPALGVLRPDRRLRQRRPPAGDTPAAIGKEAWHESPSLPLMRQMYIPIGCQS